MYISYQNLCNKIFTSEGYTFVQPGDFHILGKNIYIVDDDYMKTCTLCLYENDDNYYITIPYPQAKIWIDAISVFNPSEKIIYSDFIDKKEGMIINNPIDINNQQNIIDLYNLIIPNNLPLDVVRYKQQIYLTRGIF